MKQSIIERPVMAIVISLLITSLGVMAMFQLPITLFPSIAPPEVNVAVEYTGANAETVIKAAIVPLERAINGVPGMKYMSSDAGNDGVGVVQILFETGTDPNEAGINVQNRVNAIMGELPTEVIKNGVKIAKEENAMLMYLNIFSNDDNLDEKFLYNYTDINVLSELKRIKGVGFADIVGAKEYAMRIWLRPDKMSAFNVSTDEVIAALNNQNIEAAPGKVGESSDRQGQELQFTIKYKGKFNEEKEYENIPIRASEDGRIVRIKDVAYVEFGTTYFDVEAKLNGKPCAAVIIKQLPGSNASEVIQLIKEKLKELKERQFLSGMDYEISYDVSRFIDASLKEVVHTFIEALLLVALVVFVFLQNWRLTIIPVLAVPVSLVGTFFFMQLLGFSLNLITLFALVLAIGIVVDNAIVVVEAVHEKMEHHHLNVMEATRSAMSELRSAIIAITLVMSAVFIPVAFMSGPSGIFYRQFALTMAIAIVLSGVVALTLTPALCVLVIKNRKPENPNWLGKFFTAFNSSYNGLENKYNRWLSKSVMRRVLTFIVVFTFLILNGLVGSFIPTGFIPNEDQGTFYVSVTTPPGATLERTKSVVNKIQQRARSISEVESVSSLSGTNILSDGTGATYGTLLINLRPWEERDLSSDETMSLLKESLSDLVDADIELFPPPAVPGYGNASGFELRLLDKTGRNDINEMQEVVNVFIDDLKKQSSIASAFTIFDASYPQYNVVLDYDKAASLGVTSGNAMATLQTMLGSEYATNFIKFGQMYKVMIQALPEYRKSPEDILRLTVKNERDEIVPFSAFVTLNKTYGVDQMTRYNMYPSAELNGEGIQGVSSGEVLKIVKKTAEASLPNGFDIDWAGISRDEANAGSEALIILFVCIFFVYLILSAQYESFVLPMVVIFSLPIGVFGALLFLLIFGLENNIYAQVSILMLVGLLGKNAILIVEFAAQKIQNGQDLLSAIVEASILRLRPIVMTSLAFIVGILPLALADGAGAIGNRTIGISAAGGMIIGTLVGLMFIPGLFVVFVKSRSQSRI